jgi:hypothetical protein
VAAKSGTKFRPADELWLAIQSSQRISEMVSDLLGVEDFEAVPSLAPYKFSCVFVLAFTGIYQWKRGEGWQKLTGVNREERGLSFQASKTVIVRGAHNNPQGSFIYVRAP